MLEVKAGRRAGSDRGSWHADSQVSGSDFSRIVGIGGPCPPYGESSGAKVESRTVWHRYAQAVPETAYASCGDLSLAYQVFGDGPVELVFCGSFASHVELYWTMPEFKAFMERLATFCRVILFDKAGVGLSDPVPQVRTLDDRASEIEAVMDAAGFGTAALLGVSEGGPAAILFAASRPERTRALILTGTTSYSFTGYRFSEDSGTKLPAGRAASCGTLTPAPPAAPASVTGGSRRVTRARSCPYSYRNSQYDSVSRSSRLATRLARRNAPTAKRRAAPMSSH